ncbi:MobC family plasmid mobilization relaxosome protein, partial [Parasutterella secunda]|uniref:plasmid mobilization relaxosome protein MobC n=1 Tax=Parasutterella secunda TaxID=626947 RepID=UPI0020114E69
EDLPRARNSYVIITQTYFMLIKMSTLYQYYGQTRNSYIISVLRNNLLSSTLLTEQELEALINSTHELNKIGVNLNQIARSINSARKSGTFTGKQFTEVLCMRNELTVKVNKCVFGAEQLLKAQHCRAKINSCTGL